MVRITQHDAPADSLQLKVDGRLTGADAGELAALVEQALAAGRAVGIDLSGVGWADERSAAVLRRLAARGARLSGCTGFVAELLWQEAALVERLRRQDPEAFTTLVRSHGGRMLAVARRLLSSEEDARDAVQEAFLAAFQAIGEFGGGARLSTWLHRIVVNAALMRLRRRKRKPEQSIDELLPAFDADGRWAGEPPTLDADAATLLEREETRTRVRAAIARLPEGYRTVLVLRDLEDLDTDEAATILGITPLAVRVRLHRARQALLALLGSDRDARPGDEPVPARAKRPRTAPMARARAVGRRDANVIAYRVDGRDPSRDPAGRLES